MTNRAPGCKICTYKNNATKYPLCLPQYIRNGKYWGLFLLKKIIAYINDSYDKTLIDPDVDKSNGMPNAADLALLKKIIAKLV